MGDISAVLFWQCAVEIQKWLVTTIVEIQVNIQSTLHEYVPYDTNFGSRKLGWIAPQIILVEIALMD